MREIMEINKDLIAASSTPMVLAILAEEDSYGYAILKRVRALSGGRMETIMSVEQIVAFVNGIDDETRIMEAENGYLPPAPPGYRYTKDYKLIPL
jgi:hypothetical protein